MNDREITMLVNSLVDRDEWGAVECIRALKSRLESLEKDCEELIKERDEREDVINELLNQVLADERNEWSSAYDFNDAVIDVECIMKSLEKDAEFLSWCADRFVHVYGESEHVDFVLKLRSMTAMQANKGE